MSIKSYKNHTQSPYWIEPILIQSSTINCIETCQRLLSSCEQFKNQIEDTRRRLTRAQLRGSTEIYSYAIIVVTEAIYTRSFMDRNK